MRDFSERDSFHSDNHDQHHQHHRRLSGGDKEKKEQMFLEEVFNFEDEKVDET